MNHHVRTLFGLQAALAFSLSGIAHSATCDALFQPVRAEHDTDLVICGDELPAEIALAGLDVLGVELLYQQSLTQCNWNDDRRGFHLVLKSDQPAEAVVIPVLDAITGEPACELTVDFPPPLEAGTPYWADAMPSGSARFVDVDGYRTRYFEAGDGPPLILLHGGQTGGFNNSAVNWQRNFLGLARHFRVFAIDRLGQGYTDNLKRDEDYPDYYSLDAKHLERFIEVMGLEGVTLVGHSQGGYPVTRVAVDRPDLVSCLVPIGPVIVPDDGELMRESMRFVSYVAGPVHPASGPTIYSSRRALMLRYPTGRNIGLAQAAGQITRFESPKIQEAVRGMSSMPPNPDHPTLRLNPAHPIFVALREQLHEDIRGGKLEVRTLIVTGDEDLQVQAGLSWMLYEMLVESGVEAGYQGFPQAGHSPHGEFVDEFNQVVIDYCLQ
ncbi:MAG: alpha/beta hydrolase [Chromatiales bacterium]|nr:alpha/beta hydrolase [Chromatiales bacterium]